MEVRTLRAWRQLRALSIRDLAQRASVAPGTVLAAERGQRTPTLRTWRRLAAALEVEPGQIAELRRAIGEESL